MYEWWLWGIVPAIADPALTLEAFILLLPCFDYTPDNGQVFMSNKSVAVPRQGAALGTATYIYTYMYCEHVYTYRYMYMYV